MPSAMPSLRSITKFALGLAQVAFLPLKNGVLGGYPLSCPNAQLSCNNTTAVADTCCFNAPGGKFLLTQFWDASPPVGPVDHWTVHGLWPDNCDGTYDAYCDASRQYTNVTDILQSFGATDLLNYMNVYWKDYKGNDESFWEHEFNKHGTCISTLETKCYTDYEPQQEVLDYFNVTVNLFKGLDSYAFLAAAGIVPSMDQTYTFAQIQAALTAPRGVAVAIQCSNNTNLDEVWYYYDVRGSIVTGQFVDVAPVGETRSCPQTGIRYLPKVFSSNPTPSVGPTGTASAAPTQSSNLSATYSAPAPTSTGGAFVGRGYLNVVTGGKRTGCIISAGTWYTTGTCATFTGTAAAGGITLSSSKGKCAIVNGALSCGSAVTTATVFTSVGSNLASSGSTTFFAAAVPSGSTQATVFTTDHPTQLTISWQGI